MNTSRRTTLRNALGLILTAPTILRANPNHGYTPAEAAQQAHSAKVMTPVKVGDRVELIVPHGGAVWRLINLGMSLGTHRFQRAVSA